MLVRVGELAAPQAAKVEGHDHAVFHTIHAALVARAKFPQLTVAADGAFREQADHFSRLQEVVDGFQGFLALARRDGHHLEQLEEGFEVPEFIDPPQHHEANRSRAGDLHQRPVYPRDVVAQQQDRPGLGKVLETQHLYLVAPPQDALGENPGEGLGQGAHRVTGANQRDPGQDVEQADTVDTAQGEGGRQGQEGQHRHVLDPVVAGEDGAELLLARVELDQGVQGNDEQPPGDTHGQECQAHVENAVQGGEQGDHHGDAQGADGNQAGLDVVAREATGDQRAEHDPDTGTGEDALDHHRVGDVQRFFGEGGEGRQHDL